MAYIPAINWQLQNLVRVQGRRICSIPRTVHLQPIHSSSGLDVPPMPLRKPEQVLIWQKVAYPGTAGPDVRASVRVGVRVGVRLGVRPVDWCARHWSAASCRCVSAGIFFICRSRSTCSVCCVECYRLCSKQHEQWQQLKGAARHSRTVAMTSTSKAGWCEVYI